MKFKVTKREKDLYEELDAIMSEFAENQETALTLFALGKNFGGSMFVGDAWKLTRGFYDILKKGMCKDYGDDNFYGQIVCAFLDAIAILAHEDSEESGAFARFLAEIYEHATDENDEVEIELVDKYEETKEDKAETFDELAAKLDKLGYYVSKKPQKKTIAKQPKKDK